MRFGTLNFQGGIQNFGGTNTNIQHNTPATTADQIRDLLTLIRTHHPDPGYAEEQLTALESELAAPTGQSRPRLLKRLEDLTSTAGNAAAVVEAAAAVAALISTQWPG